jgi:hypothetical protein
MKEKLEISRIGSTIELDNYRIYEVLEKGHCTFISPMFYNKGVHKVKNSQNEHSDDFAINIDKIEAATYQGLVEEFGEDCVDSHLWDDVPDGSIIFFYSVKLEKDLVDQQPQRKTEYYEA